MKEEREEYRKDESGYNESQADLQAEVGAGEWQRLIEFPAYQNRSRQGKIIAMHQAISNRLEQLVQLYYQMVSKRPQEAVKMLKELKKLRALQDYLLNCLTWEQKGEMSKHPMPDELKDIL